jgi:hypothetical protein
MKISEYLKTNPRQDRKSKYGNLKTEYNGYVYMSKKEAEWAMTLDSMKKAKDLKDRVISYERQVPFILLDAFVDSMGIRHNKITYVSDFVVTFADGRKEVQDVKPASNFTTNIYKLKKKMLLSRYRGILFKEIH